MERNEQFNLKWQRKQQMYIGQAHGAIYQIIKENKNKYCIEKNGCIDGIYEFNTLRAAKLAIQAQFENYLKHFNYFEKSDFEVELDKAYELSRALCLPLDTNLTDLMG